MSKVKNENTPSTASSASPDAGAVARFRIAMLIAVALLLFVVNVWLLGTTHGPNQRITAKIVVMCPVSTPSVVQDLVAIPVEQMLLGVCDELTIYSYTNRIETYCVSPAGATADQFIADIRKRLEEAKPDIPVDDNVDDVAIDIVESVQPAQVHEVEYLSFDVDRSQEPTLDVHLMGAFVDRFERTNGLRSRPAAERAARLVDLKIPLPDGRLVRLGDICKIRTEKGPNVLVRHSPLLD